MDLEDFLLVGVVRVEGTILHSGVAEQNDEVLRVGTLYFLNKRNIADVVAVVTHSMITTCDGTFKTAANELLSQLSIQPAHQSDIMFTLEPPTVTTTATHALSYSSTQIWKRCNNRS